MYVVARLQHTSLSVHCLSVGVAFFVVAWGESPVREEEGEAVIREGKDRRLVVLGPLEQPVVGWPAQCCDGMPCEHQDHVWRGTTCIMNNYYCTYNELLHTCTHMKFQ